MDKLKMHTPDVTDTNIQKIGELFPNCITERLDENGKPERAIDFDKLKQELSKEIVEGPQERYQFTWPDKRNAMRLANTPTNMTLRPDRDSSSPDFDTTENLYIEGDNLEVLKLLRENYLGKVKMIYIDPPYNTGNDFVYNDDFSQNADEYKENSGQTDDLGNRMVQNTESNGRFHTDWLNMMYPRLKVARDLLTEDGVIFISIDDNEVENLKKICDEIFSANHFVTMFTWQRKTQPSFLSKEIANVTEYILVYKNSNASTPMKGGYIDTTRDGELINIGNPIAYRILPKESVEIERGAFTGTLKKGKYGNGVLEIELLEEVMVINGVPQNDIQIKGRINRSQETLFSDILKGARIYIRSTSTLRPTINLNRQEASIKPPISLLTKKIDEKIPTNTDASSEIKRMFDGINVMDYPKPSKLVSFLIDACTFNDKNASVLDFFSGSATTAHAVMQLNAEDGGNRKFIMVQLPEKTPDGSEALKQGYQTICEIGKERIRRAGRMIKEESPLTTQNLDTGFRVLKLDTSNMQDVYYTPERFSQDTLFADNVKPDRSSEDLLFQVMLECNLPLSAKIERKTIAGKEVFNVNEGYLIACFDEDVNEAVITEVAKQKPYYFIMRDKSLSSDNVADNFEQIFNAYSKDTIRKIL